MFSSAESFEPVQQVEQVVQELPTTHKLLMLTALGY